MKGTRYTTIGLGEHDIGKKPIGRGFIIVACLSALRTLTREVIESITIRRQKRGTEGN